MTKSSVKQTTHKTKTTNKRRASLLRRRAEDEPTTSSSSSMTSDSDRSSSRFVGCRGDSHGLSAVAERRGFVSVSEQFPRMAERPGVATPQRSKPLAPPSWGGNTTYKTTHTNNEGVRGRTRAGTSSGTGAGTPPDTLKYRFSRFVSPTMHCHRRFSVTPILPRHTWKWSSPSWPFQHIRTNSRSLAGRRKMTFVCSR